MARRYDDDDYDDDDYADFSRRRSRYDDDDYGDDYDRPRRRLREETPEEKEARRKRNRKRRKASARMRLMGPSSAIMACAILHLLLACLGLLINGFKMLEAGDPMVGWRGADIPPLVHAIHALYIFCAQTFMLIGALCMMRGSSYGMAMITAIGSLIPCLCSSCAILGIPFGIWALVTLMDREVQSVFR